MIAFDLRCSNGHSFEGWFKDLDSFNEQNKERMITCPLCKDTEITKVLSPVAFKSNDVDHTEKLKSSEKQPDYEKLAMRIMEYIENNFDDVGTNFTKEALKIYYGVAEKRNIRGTATVEEEQILKNEGIKFTKLPLVKTKDNSN